MNSLDVLRKAKALITDETKWYKWEVAGNAKGEPVPPKSPDATKWSILGAVLYVGDPGSYSVNSAIDALLNQAHMRGYKNLYDFNRRVIYRSDIFDAFDDAIYLEGKSIEKHGCPGEVCPVCEDAERVHRRVDGYTSEAERLCSGCLHQWEVEDGG